MSLSYHFWAKPMSLILSFALAAMPVQSSMATPVDSEAQERFDRGVELYQAGDIQAAHIEFNRAYQMAPNYRLLFNIGQTAADLKDYVTARKSLREYLEQGGDEISPERKTEVEAELDQISQYLAWIKLDIDTPDATVKIDGVLVDHGNVAEEGLLVSAGRRRIEVTKTGYEPWDKTVDIAGQDDLQLSVELVSLTGARGLTPSDTRSPSNKSTRRRMGPLFWTGASLTLVFGATATALGLMTLRSQEHHFDELKKVPTTQEALDTSARHLRHYALGTDISIGLAATAAIVTIGAAIWGPGGRKKKSRESKIQAGVGPKGRLMLHGRF